MEAKSWNSLQEDRVICLALLQFLLPKSHSALALLLACFLFCISSSVVVESGEVTCYRAW